MGTTQCAFRLIDTASLHGFKKAAAFRGFAEAEMARLDKDPPDQRIECSCTPLSRRARKWLCSGVVRLMALGRCIDDRHPRRVISRERQGRCAFCGSRKVAVIPLWGMADYLEGLMRAAYARVVDELP
jgi:hypothetical protein